MNLINNLIKQGWFKTPRIIEAFRKIKRKDFLPEGMQNFSELDQAMPIGYGQTISQPLVVAFMLELLQPQIGDKILDIGSGSGWTSALLAHCVSGGELKLKIKNQKSKIDGRVISIEIVPELKKFGERNVAKYNFIEKGIVEFICADGTKGWEKEAPYDKILCSAAARKEIPQAWKEQLKIGGRIVSSVDTSIWLFIKKSEKRGDEPSVHLHSTQKSFVFEETEYPGFVFVPLVEK
jgi:protein-L-isoaspartate(D-aspartate) O-methyltransferase